MLGKKTTIIVVCGLIIFMAIGGYLWLQKNRINETVMISLKCWKVSSTRDRYDIKVTTSGKLVTSYLGDNWYPNENVVKEQNRYLINEECLEINNLLNSIDFPTGGYNSTNSWDVSVKMREQEDYFAYQLSYNNNMNLLVDKLIEYSPIEIITVKSNGEQERISR